MNPAMDSLEVVARGAVSPAGCSPQALWEIPLPNPTMEAILSQPEHRVPVRRVDPRHDALLRWQQEPRLRRASPLALFLMEAANQAMAGAPEMLRDRVGLVCALSTGSVIYIRKFYADTLNQGRRSASPALFPETAYNSPVSHLAALLKITGACYTLMGDETAWVEALRVAQVWLARGTVDAVLVVGGEELDAIALEAFYRTGWVRRGLVASEGAGAVLVRKPQGPARCIVKVAPNSVSFRSRNEQKAAWEKIFTEYNSSAPLLLPGNVVPPSLVGQISVASQATRLSPDWGAAFTASAAWSFLQASQYRLAHQPFNLLVPGANIAVTVISFV